MLRRRKNTSPTLKPSVSNFFPYCFLDLVELLVTKTNLFPYNPTPNYIPYPKENKKNALFWRFRKEEELSLINQNSIIVKHRIVIFVGTFGVGMYAPWPSAYLKSEEHHQSNCPLSI